MKASTSPYFRSGTGGNPRSSLTSSSSKKAPVKRNKSILSFFQKADGPPKSTNTQHRITRYVTRTDRTAFEKRVQIAKENANGQEDTTDGLFFEEDVTHERKTELTKFEDTPDDRDFEDEEIGYQYTGDVDDERYNEHGRALKKRRLDSGVGESTTDIKPAGAIKLKASPPKISRNGPFVDESDSDEDGFGFFQGELGGETLRIESKADKNSPASRENRDAKCPFRDLTDAGDMKPDLDAAKGSSDMTDIIPKVEKNDMWNGNRTTPCETGEWMTPTPLAEDEAAICPVCCAGLGWLTDTEASVHVNNCLDGNPTPAISTTPTKAESELTLTRAERKLLPRPGQKNPFSIESKSATDSAFSKLMSANAEDFAWTTAAASELASKGKQSYQRTCPFYKILPGFSICVDAFRYGAVEGCNAYFLSHFHSDHYVGLSASWQHGPIYCSKVTGNLVRQQLRVDPKWIVDIEWEEKVEVPETGGVQVTMIPANHCPGSSLFLFEKPLGKGVQRILHCGDFRASPAHVQHPSLRPTVPDEKTGQLKYQTIDVCYLDTTYLSPKYGFPNQDDVIDACADKCVILNGGRRLGRSDSTRSKSGQNMTKYLAENITRTKELPSTATGKLLVVIGTYSIGKERLCLGIARALNCKIYAPPAKQKICACLEDEEFSGFLTTNPLKAQVHMQSLMDISAETILEYMNTYKGHFSRVVAFRPTGWNYRPPASRVTDNPSVNSVLYSDSWKTPFSVDDIVPARGSNQESMCFSVPYSEHSSFRDLTAFCCALRIGRIIPTVGVKSRSSREKMKSWIEKWEAEKRKSGLFKVEEGATRW